jgi:hypothetical protein
VTLTAHSEAPPVADTDPRQRKIRAALVAVGVGFFLLQIFFVGVHFGFTHDETVYLSQLNPAVPRFGWNAWRAWGMPVLMSPVTAFSSGVAPVRIWATVLSSGGLVLAFWPWVKVYRGWVVPVASLLFATSWVSIYFGNSVQPNLYIALGAVAAGGLFVRATYGDSVDRRRRVLVLLGFALMLLSLIRPSDGLLVGVPLGLMCLVVPQVRRPIVVVPLAIGWVVGFLPWLVESFTTFGGPVHRYRLSNAYDAVGGLHLNAHTASLYLRMLNGPFYAGTVYGGAGGLSVSWLAVTCAALVLVAVGVVVSRELGRLTPTAIALVVTATLTLFYVFLLRYGSVRFLLPMFALLSLPIAVALVWLSRRTLLAALPICCVVGANIGFHVANANTHLRQDRALRHEFQQIGQAIRGAGVQKPCVVLGSVDPTPVAYSAHCLATAQVTDVSFIGEPLAAQAMRWSRAGKSVVVVTHADEPTVPLRGWTEYFFVIDGAHVNAWLSPDVGTP